MVSKLSTVQNFGQVGLKEPLFPHLLERHTYGVDKMIKTDNVNKASCTKPGILRLKNGRYYQYIIIITIITIFLITKGVPAYCKQIQ